MRTHLFSILIVGLLACGGSKPHPAPSGGTGNGPGDTSGTSGTSDTSDASGAGSARERQPGDAGTFEVKDTDKSSRPNQGKLKPTATEAAVRLFVVDKDNAPIEGIAVSLTAPDGKKYYTEETGADGFTEVLVPIGQTYGLVYLSLGRHDVSAKDDVANKPNLNLKLTLRYKVDEYPKSLVLENVEFPTGKAILNAEAQSRLDAIVEYMAHKKSVRIEISGHTDNVGDKAANKALSQKRADSCRDYVVSKGINGDRIKAVGYGDAKPIAPNTTPEGRQKNRRIEAAEL